MTYPDQKERTLLVVCRDPKWAPSNNHLLGDKLLKASFAASLEEAKTASRPRGGWDVVAFNVNSLGSLEPKQALAVLKEIAPEATFLPISGSPDPHEALFYLKNGSFEYLEEPLSSSDFLRALEEAVVNRDTFREILQLNKTLESQKQQLLYEKEELERKNRELEAVSQLAQALASTLDIGEVLTHLTKSIHETFSFDRIVVGLVDHDQLFEEAKVAFAPRDDLTESGLKRMRWFLKDGERHPWIRTVLQEGRMLMVRDPSEHPETKNTPLADIHRNAFIKAPMIARGRIVGTITVENRETGRDIEPEHLEILGIFADAAAMAIENAQLYQKMKDLSVRDELTGLYNRRHLLHQLNAEWNHAQRHQMNISLLMIDIDYFKLLNDRNDHLTGDAALRKLAQVLLRKTRGIDTVARYGGEEFIVILPRTSRGNAVLVAEKLRLGIEKTKFIGEEAVPGGSLTISVGVAEYPADASTPKELIERADWALYEAKASGRNSVSAWDGKSRPRGAAAGDC